MLKLIKLGNKMAGSQQNAGLQYNSLTSGSKIIGTIVTDGDIRVDGMVEGDVKCSSKLSVLVFQAPFKTPL